MKALKLHLMETPLDILTFREKEGDITASCRKPYSGHENGCPYFGKTWNCPSYAPSISEMKQKLQGMRSCFLIIGESTFEKQERDDEETRESYEDLTNKINRLMGEAKKKWKNALILNGPPCEYCEEEDIGPCTCPSAPCSFPEVWTYPPEAVGLDLFRTMEKLGNPIQENLVERASRIGVTCFSDEAEAHAFKEYMKMQIKS